MASNTVKTYLEPDFDDYQDLGIVLHPDTAIAIRMGETIPVEDQAIESIDELFAMLPGSGGFTLYTNIAGAELLRKGGEVIEGAYLTGELSKRNKRGTVTLVIEVPKEVPAIKIHPENDVYILPRGLTLMVEAAEEGDLAAKIVGYKRAKFEGGEAFEASVLNVWGV